jgi:hypothetical protein
MEMLHPSDAYLINLYSIITKTKLSVVREEKTKIYYILLKPSCSRYRISVISNAYKKRTAGLCLEGEAKQTGTRFHPNFNYVMAFTL